MFLSSTSVKTLMANNILHTRQLLMSFIAVLFQFIDADHRNKPSLSDMIYINAMGHDLLFPIYAPIQIL